MSFFSMMGMGPKATPPNQEPVKEEELTDPIVESEISDSQAVGMGGPGTARAVGPGGIILNEQEIKDEIDSKKYREQP
jgi:hypothetical protein